MEDYKKQHELLEEELQAKYKADIDKLCDKYECDVGVGYNRLQAIARGNTEYGEGLDLNIDEFKTDYIKLLFLSEQIARAAGNL